MERNWMKVTTPNFGVSGCIWIIQKRYVEKCALLILHSQTSYRGWVRVLFGNTLKTVVIGEFALRGQCIFSVLSCCPKMNFSLLRCLIGQLRGSVVIVVDIYIVVLLHFFMIWPWRSCREHWIVPRAVWTIWELSTSHPIIIVRSSSFQKVHLCVVE